MKGLRLALLLAFIPVMANDWLDVGRNPAFAILFVAVAAVGVVMLCHRIHEWWNDPPGH